MQVLFEGIYDEFTGSTGAGSLYVELGGRLHFTEAPQGSAYPYGVYHLISNVPSWIFGTDENTMENYIIQFNLYSEKNSSTDINTAFLALTTLYDWCDLDVDGYSHIYMKREINNLTRENDIWNYFVQYRIEVQKN